MVAPTGESRVRSSHDLALPFRDPQSVILPVRRPVDADRSSRRRPPLRLFAPSVPPPWRVHFPEPGPRWGGVRPRSAATGLSPEGDSPASSRWPGRVPVHCPTADESDVVEDGSYGPVGDRRRSNGRWAAVQGKAVFRGPRGVEFVRFAGRSRSAREQVPRFALARSFSTAGPRARCRSGCLPGCAPRVRGPPSCDPSSWRPRRARSRGTLHGASTTPGDHPFSTRPEPDGIFQRWGASGSRGIRSCSIAIGPRWRPDQGLSSVGSPADPARFESSRSSSFPALGPEDRSRYPSEEGCQDARPEWFWFLVASFHPRFVPPSPFRTTLAAYPSPGSSGMFHPVTLMGFGFRQKYLPGGFPRRPARGPSDAVCPPRSPPLHRDEVRRSGPASIPFPASRGAVRNRSWGHSLRGVRPFAKRFRARPGRDARRPT
jgi:hypothetical protein